MLKQGDYYFPSVNILGVWYFIIRKDNKTFIVPKKPQRGLSHDKAQEIENEFKFRAYPHIKKIAYYANGLIAHNIQEPEQPQKKITLWQRIKMYILRHTR